MNAQQAYLEWVDSVKLREAVEYDYLQALASRNFRRVLEIRRYWLAEAREYVDECLMLYRRARRVERTS